MLKELIVLAFVSFTAGLLTQAFISEMISRYGKKKRESFIPPF